MPSASPISVSAAEVEQPIPVSVITRQPRNLQPEHDANLAKRDFGGHLSEAGALGQSRTRDSEILVENFDLPARPAQLCGTFDQPVLALRRFPIVFDLRRGGLAHVDERKP